MPNDVSKAPQTRRSASDVYGNYAAGGESSVPFTTDTQRKSLHVGASRLNRAVNTQNSCNSPLINHPHNRLMYHLIDPVNSRGSVQRLKLLMQSNATKSVPTRVIRHLGIN